MKLQDGDNYPLYRSVWVRNDRPDELVCLQYPGQELFGTPYRVLIYDRNLKLVRSGELTAQQDGEPLAIVELKAEGKGIPATRRGKWQLAIVLAGRRETWDRTKPLRLVGFEGPDDRANYVMCELIKWDGDDDLTGGAGSLSDVDTIEFRTAERNWPVSADGTVQMPLSKLPVGAP
jgi:hypothetical protein